MYNSFLLLLAMQSKFFFSTFSLKKKTCSSHKITFDIQLIFIYGLYFYFTAVTVPKYI